MTKSGASCFAIGTFAPVETDALRHEPLTEIKEFQNFRNVACASKQS
jgi:hypothetical protein